MNILFTSVGRRSYLVEYFKEALKGEGKVHVANSTEISPAFQIADFSVVSPLIYDENYIPFLLDYCKKNQIEAIISLFDIDLPILANNMEKFKTIGTKVIVSDTDVINKCNDKWHTYEFLKKEGFDQPKTYLKVETVLNDIKNQNLSYPLIVKPRWGMGSIGVYEAENEKELLVFYDKVKRNILESYLKYESLANIETSVMIQEKLKGQEYGLDVINDLEGNYQTTVVKKKIAMRSGETDCAITVNDDSLKQLGKKMSQSLKHIGNLDVDVFRFGNKNYILEMNARFGGGYPFSHLAGINLPLAIINWLKGDEHCDEYLKENFNVMAHKDINLIKIDF